MYPQIFEFLKIKLASLIIIIIYYQLSLSLVFFLSNYDFEQEPQGLLFRQIFESFLIQLASSTSVKIHKNIDDKQVIQGAECAVQLYALNEYIKQVEIIYLYACVCIYIYA